MKDVVRISSVVPRLKLADVEHNSDLLIEYAKKALSEGKSNIVLFPELCLTGYTCGDLFFQKSLVDSVNAAVVRIIKALSEYDAVTVFGAPLMLEDKLYNTAIVTAHGRICGIVPKTFLPNYNEFSEKRWFSSSSDAVHERISSKVFGIDEVYDIPFGRDLVFSLDEKKRFGVEICEDLWSPIPPSTFLALGGAEMILNLSASDETASKRAYRRGLVLSQSSKCMTAYAYTSSGIYESTTDLVFSGSAMIALDGKLVCENEDLFGGECIITSDVDLGEIESKRLRSTDFKDSVSLYGKYLPVRQINIDNVLCESDGLLLNIKRSPFIPSDKKERLEYCRSIFEIQTIGLMRRLEQIGADPIVGTSGGLDSTLALLVAHEAVKRLGKPTSCVHGVTLPGFGTSGRTYNNSRKLIDGLGASYHEINIREACLAHFKDIGHDFEVHDLTYENAQARERTQILMDLAGKLGGLVVGTGDLSELALGWCTYNADHMSMYGVNAGVPKTVIKEVIKELVDDGEFADVADVLRDILETPISPELLPPDESGRISQSTETLVGPYELHDFYLYYILKYGYEPEKIYDLAKIAFHEKYNDETLLSWLRNFYKRFFAQQYKRSCQPDGVKVDVISVSPRGGLQMPSDAYASLWLEKVDRLADN